jgi:Zn finger protein HypA/HybF involved in hydrogenase expression
VDSTNETMNAIANNGDVEILFYEEEEPILQRLNNIDWNPTYINTSNGGYVYGSTSGDIVGSSFTTTNLASFKSSDSTLSFSNNLRSNKYESKYDQQPRNRSFAKKSKSVETGRVEQGSSSDQSFKTVSKEFNSWTVSTSVWKLLPESQKPIEKSDLIYRCPKCSTRIKKSSWKFCPECGNELKQETCEDQLSKLSKEELIERLKNK